MTTSRIPLYNVTGTHYDCAYTLGTLTHEAIRHRIGDDVGNLAELFAFVQTEYGLRLQREFIATARLFFPWYWDEICGLADGSGIPLEQIVVLNFLNETKTAYELLQEKQNSKQINETGENGCTTVLLNRQDTNTYAILHNEDHDSSLYLSGCLVEADIHSSEYDDGKRMSPNEKFVAYCYAGTIPGNGFGANKHGFAFALNGLYPKFVAHGRLPRQMINRALLSIGSEQELDNLLRLSPVAFGFCVNGTFFHQDNYILNYEIGPNLKIENENYIDKRLVINDGQKENKKDDECVVVSNYLVHYNHYERLNKFIIQQKSLDSTYSRWKRGQEIGELFTIDDALNLLGDDENKAFPLFRIPSQTDTNSVTLCTAYFNFHTLQLFVYQHNPKHNNQPSLIYNLANLLA